MATTLLVETSNANEALCKILYPTCVSWNNKYDTAIEVFLKTYKTIFSSYSYNTHS